MFRRTLAWILTLSLCASSFAFAEDAFAAYIGDSTEETTAEEEIADEEDPEESLNIGNISDYPTLQNGSKDEDGSIAYVVTLQSRLIQLGYLYGNADGSYGTNTEEAVKAFQQANGLSVTGIADAATQALLYSDSSKLVTGTAAAASNDTSDAFMIQSCLAQWGFLTGKVDGSLGTDSQDAIASFKSYVLTYYADQIPTPIPTESPEPTPEVTQDPNALPEMTFTARATPVPSTSESIKSTGEVDSTLMAFVNDSASFQVYRMTVRSGDSGDEVKRVQTRLRNLKYLYNVTGNFGDQTTQALTYFQTKNGLTVTGVADEATQRALFSGSAIASEEYVFPYKFVVDISEQRVYAYAWAGTGYSSTPTKKMKCSTGKDATPTPTGTFQATGPSSAGEWYYFTKYNCYAKWATRIVGGILFHSVTYSSSKRLNSGSVHNLGRKASHGCVRLSVEDAKWVYDNCVDGNTVVIQK